jgi:hypothetical protein
MLYKAKSEQFGTAVRAFTDSPIPIHAWYPQVAEEESR